MAGHGYLRGPARWLAVGFLVAALAGAVSVPPASAALPASFGTKGSGAGQFVEPRGIAVEQKSGDVYVADRNNNRIDKFGPEGEFLRAWGFAVADGSSEVLQSCTSSCFGGTGSPFEGSGTGQFKSVEGIAVDNSMGFSHGDVYVIDAGNNRVQKFGPEGEFILMFGGEVNATTKGNICLAGEACKVGVPGAGAGAFKALQGRSIAVGSTGTVYVGDENRVQLFSEDGVVQSEIALSAAGAIENLALASANEIYVKGSALEGVRKYDGTGAEVPPPRDEAGQREDETLAIGPGNGLFVNHLQEGVHHIFAYNDAGVQTASFDAGGEAANGQRGIAYSEYTKAVYVLNPEAVRLAGPPPPGPFVLIGSETASEVEPTTVTLGAIVNPEGSGSTEYHFEYGTTTTYGENTADTPLAGGQFEDQPASTPVTGLQPSTTYHFRVVATNGTEIADGPDQTFTTLPPVSIDSTSASQVKATSARLQAELNPHGLSSDYHFEYYAEGEAAHPKSIPVTDATLGPSTTDTAVSELIQELLPSTVYHYRVVAYNTLNAPGEVVEGPYRSFTTQGPASILADGRTWELVSPPNKHGAPLEPITEEGGIIRAAADGGAFAYVALGPVNNEDGEPKGVRSPHDSQLLANRGSTGWSTQDLTTPHEQIATIQVGFPSEYKFFTEDLGASIVEPAGATPLSPQATERTPYRREANGEFVPLVTPGNVPAGTEFGEHIGFRTATPDLKHMLLVSPLVLSAGFRPGFEPAGKPNVYELTGGEPQLVSVLPNGEPTTEVGASAGIGGNGLNMRGAISNDGNRVFFETNQSAQLYVRDVKLQQTVQVNVPQPGAVGGQGIAVFQAASSDGDKVFFTDTSRLTTSSTAAPGKPDLYMCEVQEGAGHLTCALSDLSVDHNTGETANVQGLVSAIDASGEHVYFAADGVLTTTPNAHGEQAVPGACESAEEATCNFYAYNTSSKAISLVAVLSSKDDPDWAGRTSLRDLGNLTARSSPDGHYFTFMSQRSLTGYDNRDLSPGAPADSEVYLFDAASGALHCVSCNPTGARPQGVFDKLSFPGLLVDHPSSWRERWLAASIPGWTLDLSKEQSLYQSRFLSNSGRLFFNAADSLVPQDTNGVEDVYEYEAPGVGGCSTPDATYSPVSGGCVNLISSGSSTEESAFLDASENGDEAFFLTAARLTTSDVDDAFDVYDAHVCSASSPCPPPASPPPAECQGDSCQHPAPGPNNPTPGSFTYYGPENPAPPASAAKAKAKSLTRAQLLARALKSCKQARSKQRRIACERRAKSRYGAKKAKAKKKASRSSTVTRRRK